MKNILAVCATLLSITVAKADDMSFIAHGYSKHLDNHNFMERNYGVAMRYGREDYGIQTGVYRNSINNTSFYFGVDYSPFQYKTNGCISFEAGPYYGVVTGYKYDITPVIGIQSAIKCDKLFVRFRAMPDPFYNSKAAGAVELGIVIKQFQCQ